MQAKIYFDFPGLLWKYQGQGGWYFISLPTDISREIRDNLKWQEEGWGRMKATATIKELEWETAIWFDKKRNTYLLPVKADIRKKVHLKIDEVYSVRISI